MGTRPFLTGGDGVDFDSKSLGDFGSGNGGDGACVILAVCE